MKNKRLLSFFITIVAFFLFITVFRGHVAAADFVDSVKFTYEVELDGTMSITEQQKIENSSSSYYIPINSEQVFYISTFKTRSENQQADLEKIISTISLTDGYGIDLAPAVQIVDGHIEVKAKFTSRLDRGKSMTFNLTYKNFELAEKNGKVWNVYLPGLAEGYNDPIYSDSGAVTESTYSIFLKVPETFGEPNFILPNSKNSYAEGIKTVYEFDANELVENTAWIQFGKDQIYKFVLKQKVSSTNELASKISETYYDLLIPRDNDTTNQKVYFEKFTPEPIYIKKDGEGNLTARFILGKDDVSEIVVSGFLVVEKKNKIVSTDAGNLNDIDYSFVYSQTDGQDITFSDLLKSAQYWEVDDSEIKTTAEKLKSNETNVYNILLSDYKFVVNTVDYDNLKIGISNVRQGALKTLKGGSSVCMEYSDLLITLLRSQGIPSRAVFGYGFDPRANNADASTQGHQWVETYIPKVGWVAVDPTWGDTGRKEYIGSDLDHAVWYIASKDVNTPSPVVKESFGNTGEITSPDLEITVLSELDTSKLVTQDEVLKKYEYTKKTELIERYEQFNIYGKIIIVWIPLFVIGLIVLSIWFSLAKAFLRLFFKKK